MYTPSGLNDVSFTAFLSLLEGRGRAEKAKRIREDVESRFRDVLTPEAINKLTVGEIVGVLNLYSLLLEAASNTSQKSPLQKHVDSLRSRGYNVMLGEKYL